MTMLVDPTSERTALEFASSRPVAGFDPGLAARTGAAFAAMQEYSNSNSRHRSYLASQAEFQTRFYQASGQRLPGWVDSVNFNARDIAEKQFDAWKAANPDSDLTFPSDDDFVNDFRRRAGEARALADRLTERSTSWSSAIGGFVGAAAGAMTDPINLLTMGFGPGPAAGIIRTALTEGAIGAASEAVVQAGTFRQKREIDPNFALGDAAYETLAAGAGAAVLGGGIKGIAALWNRSADRVWPRHIRDAGNVVTREAAVPASRFDRSAQGSAVYRAAIDKATDDIIQGRPIDIPQEAFLQANTRPGRIYDADGRSVAVRYELVEADSLVASHGDDMMPNPAFPPELQPRDRTRAISADQIQGIAGNLQPERLGFSPQAESGAPIVGPDGLVESGNARVMALRRAYAENGTPAGNYRAFLRSQNFDVDSFENPVLVARRVSELSPEERIGFVTAANRSTALRLGASEQALADARLIDDAVLSKLEGRVDALENGDFVRAFMRRLPRAEQGDLVDANGALSQAGARRLSAALMGRAYGDAALLGRALEDADSNIKGIAGALTDAAPAWAKLRDAVARGDIPPGMDITDDLLEAVRLIMKARDEGRTARELIDQAEMFGGPNEIAKILARAMYGDDELRRAASRKKIAAFLADFAEEARKNDAGPRLFGDPLSAGEVLTSSLARVGRQDLERVAADRLTPEALDKMASATETADAVVEEARRLDQSARAQNFAGRARARLVERLLTDPAASMDATPAANSMSLTVDLGDGLGPRPLKDIMDEADADIAAAADLEACVGGKPNDDLGT